MDAVFIDNIFLPEPIVVEPPVQNSPTLDVMGIASEGFQLSISGDASTEYELQYSSDLKTWVGLSKVTTDQSGEVIFTDFSASVNFDKETWKDGGWFYRVIIAAPEE